MHDDMGWPDEIQAIADVSIDDEGRAERVVVVVPPLTRRMARPIEDAIAEWSFSTATEGVRTVPRTTSVFVIVRFVQLLDSDGRIEIEKVSEGPRMVRRAHHPCLAEVGRAKPTLRFVVTKDGHAEDVRASQSPSKDELCAIELIRETIFKPDTINGQAVASPVTREIVIHP